MLHKLKMIGTGVLCLLGIVLIVQNVGSVETRILFYTFSMPRAVLLFVTFVAGFAAGSLWTTRRITGRGL